jgi:hypothetical protein
MQTTQKLLFFRECLIETTEIICRDNGPVIKKTYPEVQNQWLNI